MTRATPYDATASLWLDATEDIWGRYDPVTIPTVTATASKYGAGSWMEARTRFDNLAGLLDAAQGRVGRELPALITEAINTPTGGSNTPRAWGWVGLWHACLARPALVRALRTGEGPAGPCPTIRGACNTYRERLGGIHAEALLGIIDAEVGGRLAFTQPQRHEVAEPLTTGQVPA